MKLKNEIDPYKTPQAKNVKFVLWLEKQSLKAYRFTSSIIIDEILKVLKQEKLAKSDDLPRGWTGKAPKIEMDVLKEIEPVLEKYLKVFKWLALGNFGGKDAAEVAEEIGLTEDFVPGSVISSYLSAIDAERGYAKELTGEMPKELPKNLMESTIKNLVKAAEPSVQYTIDQLKYNIMQSVVAIIDDHNAGQINIFMDEAGNLDDKSSKNLKELADKADKYMEETAARRALKKTVKLQEKNTVLGIQDHIAKGSSTGAQQAMFEIHGTSDSELDVVWITMEDERVCKYCNGVSKDASGNYIRYKMSDFKPYGYNRGKKQKDWVLTVPKAHPHCACYLAYIPKGFSVEASGVIKRGR